MKAVMIDPLLCKEAEEIKKLITGEDKVYALIGKARMRGRILLSELVFSEDAEVIEIKTIINQS